jgi:hypothetical protein
MREKGIGAFVIGFTLVAAMAFRPLMAAVMHTPAATPVPTTIVTGENNGGTIGTNVPLVANPKEYGPVNQNAPLDFSTQPKSVPRNYVAGQLYNVQVLKKYDYAGVLGQMAYFTTALGVNCQYCHNVNNFAYDTPTKRIARTMLRMTIAIQHQHLDPIHKKYSNFVVTGQVGCETCHRGAPLIAVKYNVVPVQYLDWPAKTSRQAGFVVDSMYGVARSLGVNCLFCHNSADFLTLQYYPTNGIAHQMWYMLDDINHKYLPANIEAVTCYTCHRGNKWPTQLVTAGDDQTPVKALPLHPAVHQNPGVYQAAGGL